MPANKLKRILFIGSKQIGLRVLREICTLAPELLIGVLTLDDTGDTRSKYPEFKKYAKENKLELYVAKNRQESEQMIAELKPDLCLVVGWYWLIGKTTLERVASGFIGIHNSLLPKYRGGAPLVWQIINNEREVGFSIFSFTQGMDDGPVWAQESVPVAETDYISDVLNKLEDKTIEVLRGIFPRILDGSVTPVGQDHELATYCAQRTPQDGNINWRQPAHDIYNFIRAQSDPYPGAFSYFNSQEVHIWKAKVFTKPYSGQPGQIAMITNEGVYVICADNQAIIIEEIGMNGQRGKANEFIKSVKGRFSNII